MELKSYFLKLSFLLTTLLIFFQVVTADDQIYVAGLQLSSTETAIPADELEIVSNQNESFIESKIFGRRRKYVFTQEGQHAYYQSVLYPFNYPSLVRDMVCFTSPPGTTISVVCDKFNLPFSNRCSKDYLGISLDGSLTSYNKYCGREIIKSSSVSNRVGLIFVSGLYSWFTSLSNRKFRCRLTVVTPPPPTPPPPIECNCGRRNFQSRIVGGTQAMPNEFPWRCYLMTTTEFYWWSFCACSIISSQWVMTGAKCTQVVRNELQSGKTLFVVVGDHDIESTSETASQQIAVESIHDHPDYFRNTEGTPFNDISLLKLSRPITFSHTISPVCLPWNYVNEDFAGTIVTVSGWGFLFPQGTIQSILRNVDLPVLTSSECASFYPGSVTSNEICTHSTEGKDICNGDDGGSMDLQRNGRHYAIGITSWSGGCAIRPAVHAKVTRFLDWIQATTGDTFCRV